MRNMQKVACGTRQELLLKPRWQTCPIEIHLLVSVAPSCVCKLPHAYLPCKKTPYLDG